MCAYHEISTCARYRISKTKGRMQKKLVLEKRPPQGPLKVALPYYFYENVLPIAVGVLPWSGWVVRDWTPPAYIKHVIRRCGPSIRHIMVSEWCTAVQNTLNLVLCNLERGEAKERYHPSEPVPRGGPLMAVPHPSLREGRGSPSWSSR